MSKHLSVLNSRKSKVTACGIQGNDIERNGKMSIKIQTYTRLSSRRLERTKVSFTLKINPLQFKHIIRYYLLLISYSMTAQTAPMSSPQATTSVNSRDFYRKYEFILECPMYRCDVEGSKLDNERLTAQIGSKFLLIEMKKDTCIIRFILPSRKRKGKKLNFEDDDIEYYKYFRITKAQLDYKAIPSNTQRYAFTLGSVITPIKLRFGPFDFSKDFTIGSTFGVKYTKSDFSPVSFSGLLGLGVSGVTLDSFSTNGKVRNRQETLAFTPSIGCMLEFGNAQVGVFTGLDMLSGSNPIFDSYVYRNKPWVSIGLGYSIFTGNGRK